MALSWNEIKQRALSFTKEWKHEVNEDAEAKSFMDGFFDVFGVSRRRLATFETKVNKLGDRQGYIDLLWKGVILIEFKSRGKDLDKAHKQATEYFPGLQDHELPRYILVSDFERFRLYDLEENTTDEFLLKDLYKNVRLFGFMAGYVTKKFKEEEKVNIEAAELMGKLHDRMKAVGYEGHILENYLVRLLFCLFADDTTIFEKNTFHDYLDNKTNKDGSDLGAQLSQLFYVLNTPKEKRLKNLDEDLAAFPYVNGKLFEETLPPASFDSGMRKILLDCCQLNWGMISPAIFGSLFQSVMDEKARRNLGAHYTSEKNILKVIKPLFLDDLWEEYRKCQDDKNKLKKLHVKITGLKFLDPACGCGNFLIIAYRELRTLELEVVSSILKAQTLTDIQHYFTVDVDQFYGIEYEEFPSQIAQVAMWLIDHQMNLKASEIFGEYFNRLPLRKSATIIHGNALRVNWNEIIPVMPWDKEKPMFNFIFGNPPFVGSAYQSIEQKNDLEYIFSTLKSAGMLDYVCAWYKKAAEYMVGTTVRTAFVSTNSIVQGEQPGIIWTMLFNLFKVKIHFAHRTFSWSNEAKGNAAVHVVIIGFADYDINLKTIFEYENIKGEPHELKVRNINPYLVEGKDIVLKSVPYPLCNVPKMQSGSAARDGGFLILSDSDKNQIVANYPSSVVYIKRFISGDDFINNIVRWCIWLKGASPTDFRNILDFQDRFKKVKMFRENSSRNGTKKMADLPYLFAEERQPEFDFLLIPKVSSENRRYIPIAYLTQEFIVSDKTFVIPNTSLYHFGILHSLMHMAWVINTCGRLESRFSYSNTIVYNNFPWPENPTTKQIESVETIAQAVLDARKQFPESSLADLYDPLTMPPVLVKAHQQLDKAVDLCYRPQPFPNETKRIEYLFELYERYTGGLFGNSKSNKNLNNYGKNFKS